MAEANEIYLLPSAFRLPAFSRIGQYPMGSGLSGGVGWIPVLNVTPRDIGCFPIKARQKRGDSTIFKQV
jgi:hypothetical protein